MKKKNADSGLIRRTGSVVVVTLTTSCFTNWKIEEEMLLIQHQNTLFTSDSIPLSLLSIPPSPFISSSFFHFSFFPFSLHQSEGFLSLFITHPLIHPSTTLCLLYILVLHPSILPPLLPSVSSHIPPSSTLLFLHANRISAAC